MNTLASISMKKQILLLSTIVLTVIAGCKKETSYVYEVLPEEVNQGGVEKVNVKNTIEFISIAYSDLFGTSIPADELYNLSVAYSSFGDKKLIEDMIVKNFMSDPNINLPTKSSMQSDPEKFITDTYKKLFNRIPNEYEKWFLADMISNDNNIEPDLIYYSLMTSNEYRYY